MVIGKSFPYLRHIVGLLSLAVVINFLFHHLNVVSDLSQFLPHNKQQKQLNVLLREAQQGQTAKLLLVRINATESQLAAQVSRQLRKNLLQEKAQIEAVYNGEQSLQLQHYDRLFSYRYLLIDDYDWSADGLNDVFKQRLRELSMGMWSGQQQWLLRDPHAHFIHYLSEMRGDARPKKRHGVW